MEESLFLFFYKAMKKKRMMKKKAILTKTAMRTSTKEKRFIFRE